MKNITKTKSILCSCYNEMLHLLYDDELDFLELSIWGYANDDNKLSWKNRLRYCWQILKTGRPYNDQIMLKREHAKELKQFIEEIYE